MTSKTAIFASPALCLAVLAVIATDNARHVTAKEAIPYHQNAARAISEFPYLIHGSWTGSNWVVPEAAVKLLHPNALLSRRYTNHPSDGQGARWADLLISQCADSRDMTGHYPPICYPSNGERLLNQRLFHLGIGDVTVDGTEYQFKAKLDQGCERKSVYNFFVVPGKGIVPDISAVRAAAGDYQRRYFGAAQFQVVQDADQPTEVRDNTFTTLIGADAGVIHLLSTAE